jgi:3-deoxy-D-manno-octulosonic-acid transferase
VLELARAQSPNLQLAYTYFSPSARAFASSLDVDFRDVLPFDAAADLRRAVAALAPTALVFSKVDVWPTLAREASRAGARLGLVSATLGAGSSRRSRVASALLRDAYSRLDRVGAISADDADRLVALGVPSGRVTVTGDTRYDQVWARAAKALAAAPLLDPLRSDRPTLVAGSTWPSDESKLLSAWERVRAARPEARLIIAPHEPTPAHLEPIERWARDSALRLRRLSASDAGDADVILVDRLGVLGDLYSIADMAYVGGAFHAAGLHSVLEPAAFGVPVLFGPRHTASRDATLLLDADAAVSASDAAGLERTLRLWLTAPEARLAAGAAARAVVHRGLGAAARSFALVLELLGG